MVVAPGEQRLARRRAQRRGMEAAVLEPALRQPLGCRRVDGAAEGARGGKACVVDEDDQNIGRALWRTQRLDRRELGIWVLCVIGRDADVLPVRNGQNLALQVFSHECAPDKRNGRPSTRAIGPCVGVTTTRLWRARFGLAARFPARRLLHYG